MSHRRISEKRVSGFHAILAGIAAAGFAVLLALPVSWAQSADSSPSNAALQAQGRSVFTARCGSCHDANAAKQLPDGTTLLARLAARKDTQAKLATRLKSMS